MTDSMTDRITGGIIKINGLKYSYPSGDFNISVPDLKILPGEITTVLGPNGSGKSTLLNLIRGRLKVTEGSVFSDSFDIARLSDLERAKEVGYTPQRSESPAGFTVEEIVEGGFYRFKNEPRPFPTEEILKRTDLLALRHRDASTLSGGEFRRVIIARLFAQDPRTLLFDEPSGDLDLKYQERLPRLLREEADKGKTVIVILHDINQALLHTDKTVLLKKGEIAAFGETKKVLIPEKIEEVYGVSVEYFHSQSGSPPILGFK